MITFAFYSFLKMEGWDTKYWFEEGKRSVVLKYYRQPITNPDFEVVGSETLFGRIEGFVRKNGDGSFDLSDCSSFRTKYHRRRKTKMKSTVGKKQIKSYLSHIYSLTEHYVILENYCNLASIEVMQN